MTADPCAPTGRVPVSFLVAEHAAELLADELFGRGAAAVAELPAELDGHVGLVADLEVADAAHLAADDEWAARFDVRRVRRLEDDRSWTTSWREHARIWRCGPDVVLRPAWIDLQDDAEHTDTDRDADRDIGGAAGGGVARAPRIEIVLDPGDAFGSGSHPTTRRCVELAAEVVREGDRVLDVGCGSGVLSVAAALAGATTVLSVDVDPEAVRVAPEAAALNGVADRIEVREGSVELAAGTYDLVLANLLVPIVEALGPRLVAAVRPGGHLVVSGLLTSHRERAEHALSGLDVVSAHVDGDWLTLLLAAPT